MFLKTKSAFTLAEVLITMTIIAVIAAMTIPAMTQNTSDTQFKMLWRNAYANLKQTQMLIANDFDGWQKFYDIVGIKSGTEPLFMRNEFAKRMNIIKQCDGPTPDCFTETGFLKQLDNTTGSYDDSNQGVLILSNGSSIYFNLPNDYIFVDVNGLKGPNIVGKDIFTIDMTAFKPTGSGTNILCPSGQGFDCSAKYLYQ